ncbi:hypothetical protein O181_055835 [Austropuccinia psidii MF-1]|uniref:Uncharacterized protein n=1 Tax=Austropuccinia psidii MF-1 TaxID=1389203 RepID=A0A9Q3E531_9BASI|nr:hypothetical protein [Austropuccinia psidii MF-1]
MSPVHLRNLRVPRNHPDDIEGLFRTRNSGRGHIGHIGGWQYTERNHTHSSIHFPIKQKPQTRGLVQPSIPLGKTWSKFPEDISQRYTLKRPYGNHKRMESHQEVQTPVGEGNQDKGESSHYPRYRRTADLDRAYSDSFRLTRSRQTQLSS